MKLFATGLLLIWFALWHDEESGGHNMETNQMQITTVF